AAAGARVRVHPASEVVGMDEPPAQALRYKKNSSMRLAINLVKSGGAHACVSAGNTGALMAISRFVLKTIAGIDRPAIATVLPNMKAGFTYVLDLGANVDCTPEQLMQFGVMGAMLVAALEHRERPTLGLLDLGVEAMKGDETVTRAHGSRQVQRREPARPARHRHQEPRRGRCARLRLRARTRARRGEEQRAAAHCRAHGAGPGAGGMIYSRIVGTGSFLPPRVMTN